MKLELGGKINSIYVQTLCAMFFHGEKFPKDTEDTDRILRVVTTDKEDGIECFAEFNVNGNVSKGFSFAPFNKEDKYERTSKTAVGKAVYEAGVALTGKHIDWGILTGIRPSKVAMDLINSYGEEEAKKMSPTVIVLDENNEIKLKKGGAN